jgi:hypothetical protein
MKIEQLPGNLDQVSRERIKEKSSVDKNQLFSELLEQEQTARKTISDGFEFYPPSINPLNGILSASTIPVPAGEDQQTLKALDSVMNRLEQVEQSLRGDAVDPQEVGSALDKISQELPGLQQQVSQLPGDHPLRQIAEEVGVLCYVESTKWNRGDYF